jgi:outer membrane cobalamin receptor
MLYRFFSIIFLFSSLSAFAKHTNVSVIVKEVTTQAELPYTNVIILDQQGEEIINDFTDDFGKLDNVNLAVGSYTIKLVAMDIDYDTTIIVGSIMSPIVIKTPLIGASPETLESISFSAAKNNIDQRLDKLVYNIEENATANGSVDEVLKKVPSVNVDLDGNVSLRGNKSVIVMIDGKPSSMYAANVADALKQIPASRIKSVEVMHTPTAKYDAEGSGGIINIITKKQNNENWSGNINAEGRHRVDQKDFDGNATLPMTKLSGSLSYKKNKWGIYANGGYNNWIEYADGNSIQYNWANKNETYTRQDFEMMNKVKITTGGLGASYRFDANTEWRAQYNYSRVHRNQNYFQQTTMYNTDNNIMRHIDFTLPQNQHSISTHFTKKFKNTLNKLDVALMASANATNENVDTKERKLWEENYGMYERNLNDLKSRELVAQIDYKHSITDNQTFEIGAKAFMKNIASDYGLQAGNGWNDLKFVASSTGRLDYNQNVFANYLQYNYYGQKISITGGLRYEYNYLLGEQQDNNKFKKSLHNILPNFIIQLPIVKDHKIQLAYNRRIERPLLNQLNPYANTSNPYNVRIGNPRLLPEQLDKFEMSHSYGNKGTHIQTALYYTYCNNGIENILDNAGEGKIVTTFDNVGTRKAWGLSMSLSQTIVGNLIFNANGNVAYKSLESKRMGLANTGVEYNYKAALLYKLPQDLSIEAEYYFNGLDVSLMGTHKTYSYHALGIKKSLKKYNLDLGLAIENPFEKQLQMGKNFKYSNGVYISDYHAYIRSVSINMNWKF